MHAYRTHHCGQLRGSDVGTDVRLSGWVHRKRDHGGVLFVDLRDHYGITQIVAKAGSDELKALDGLRNWDDYVQELARLLAAPAKRTHAINIPIAVAPVAPASEEPHA